MACEHVVLNCGKCTAERDALRVRLAEVEGENEQLKQTGPLWLAHAIAVMHECVDLTDPRDPVGAALTRAGLERVPVQARIDYDDLLVERDAAKAECARLKDWRNNISNVIKTAPEFAPGQWAGDKEGWGYHFEIVAYVLRDRRLLAAEVTNLQDSLKRSTEDWEEQFNKREALEARVGELERRQQELLATIVKVTNETPYSDEIRGALEQRGTLLAEVGTLKARVAELEEAALRAAGSKP